MVQLRVAAASLIVALAVVACASSSSSPSVRPSAIPTSAAPSALPTSAAPSALPSSTPATPSASSAAGQTIGLTEWKVAVASSMKAGPATFTISNNGTTQHELLIFKSELDAAAYPTNAAGDIVEEGAGITLVSDGANIDPAGSQSRTVDLKPGKYLFVCNLPAHFKQGMFTVVTVTP